MTLIKRDGASANSPLLQDDNEALQSLVFLNSLL